MAQRRSLQDAERCPAPERRSSADFTVVALVPIGPAQAPT
ncbi:hypothetical protein HMPREF9946_01900 [Acetobacteraceae bacterium AT-5844]|nr:hypothetical protein HMPREF9946_01900 [Acetobacteraceae bacterium AT-5844]